MKIGGVCGGSEHCGANMGSGVTDLLGTLGGVLSRRSGLFIVGCISVASTLGGGAGPCCVCCNGVACGACTVGSHVGAVCSIGGAMSGLPGGGGT
eukprot:13013522-Ditylum_brightwellii.AAC.1